MMRSAKLSKDHDGLIFPGDSEKLIWNREYTKIQAIPSSTRTTPSKALKLASELLDPRTINSVLDFGCGNGRNAVYLAKFGCHVDAIDFSTAATDQLRLLAKKEHVAHLISVHKQSFWAELPSQVSSYDLVLDSYVSCHFTDNDRFNRFWEMLRRSTRLNGYVYSSVFSTKDQYYSEISETQPHNKNTIRDPNNGIAKRLFTEEEYRGLVTRFFSLEYFLDFEFGDIVLGKNFRRRLYVVIGRKV